MDATPVSVDAQGRVTIPPALMSRAGLGKEATLHGVGDHIEIWNPERLAVVIQEAQANFEANAEEVAGRARAHEGRDTPDRRARASLAVNLELTHGAHGASARLEWHERRAGASGSSSSADGSIARRCLRLERTLENLAERGAGRSGARLLAAAAHRLPPGSGAGERAARATRSRAGGLAVCGSRSTSGTCSVSADASRGCAAGRPRRTCSGPRRIRALRARHEPVLVAETLAGSATAPVSTSTRRSVTAGTPDALLEAEPGAALLGCDRDSSDAGVRARAARALWRPRDRRPRRVPQSCPRPIARRGHAASPARCSISASPRGSSTIPRAA